MMPQARLQPSAPMSIVRTYRDPSRDTERTGAGENHDQAKEHFRDTLVRFQHALGGFDGFVWHEGGVVNGVRV